MKTIFYLLMLLSINAIYASDTLNINDDLQLIKINEHAYIHASWSEVPNFGTVESNGFIYISGDKAVLLDTPMSDSVSRELVNYILDTMKLKIAEFIPNHWHDDCTAGLGYVNSLGIPSLSSKMTHDILVQKGLPTTGRYFTGADTIDLNGKKVICYYPGGGHTIDNIVVWFPADNILFAGCMVKSAESTTLGNTADAVMGEWAHTIEHLLNTFPQAEIVIPGHGDYGGLYLLYHTIELLNKK